MFFKVRNISPGAVSVGSFAIQSEESIVATKALKNAIFSNHNTLVNNYFLQASEIKEEEISDWGKVRKVTETGLGMTESQATLDIIASHLAPKAEVSEDEPDVSAKKTKPTKVDVPPVEPVTEPVVATEIPAEVTEIFPEAPAAEPEAPATEVPAEITEESPELPPVTESEIPATEAQAEPDAAPLKASSKFGKKK